MLSAKFVPTVGVAPGTSTVYIPYATPSDLKHNSLGMVVDDNWYMTGRTSRTRDPGYYDPNFQPSASGGLAGTGVTIGPSGYDVNRTIGSEPFEEGDRFIESQNAPNDAELSRVYGYMPVHAGWTHVKGAKNTGLGNAGMIANLGSDEDVKEMLAIQKHQARLQTVTTVSLTILAALGIVQAVREIVKYKKASTSY